MTGMGIAAGALAVYRLNRSAKRLEEINDRIEK
jgi:hypothetical protein